MIFNFLNETYNKKESLIKNTEKENIDFYIPPHITSQITPLNYLQGYFNSIECVVGTEFGFFSTK